MKIVKIMAVTIAVAMSIVGLSSTARAQLVTVPTAAGIDITVSSEFAAPAQEVIAAAVSEGMKFLRINCFDLRRTHKTRSNHKSGNACDAYPSIPARIVRAAGLRSGCDFRDCPHFDNAKNVGGMAFWNNVRHGNGYASATHRHSKRPHRVREAARANVSTPQISEFSPRRKHTGRHRDGCSRAGDVAGINCQLRLWVHCSGGAVRATSFDANSKRMCKKVHGYIIAHKNAACGTRFKITNAVTGASIDAVVGDRGPGTIAEIDLAHQTAAAIGIKGSGCVYVGGSNNYATAGPP